MSTFKNNFQNLKDINLVSKLEDWTFSQFSDHYTPSPRNVTSFVCGFLNEMIAYYDMPLNVTFDEIINEWEISEPFNNYFLD